ncbi:hypothetical protein JCM18694_20730 [Prolixibacter denitrificans]|uniref:Uncharacterized protein n=1 Tax=Prolixibacter denitrificans TaxID=1541063 RepID=A0ABQ0ZK18_9BACT|nr:hypothetical protein JCM18694_20730 [Prolixibacter denitrificans]
MDILVNVMIKTIATSIPIVFISSELRFITLVNSDVNIARIVITYLSCLRIYLPKLLMDTIY